MEPAPETLTHPVFGEVHWQSIDWAPGSGWWVARIENHSGDPFEVHVEPDGDRFAVIEPAAALYHQVLAVEAAIRLEAVQRDLLSLYNRNWIQEGDAVLTKEELARRLGLRCITISPDAETAISLSYDDGRLFGGHAIEVAIDNAFHVSNVMLVG